MPTSCIDTPYTLNIICLCVLDELVRQVDAFDMVVFGGRGKPAKTLARNYLTRNGP